MLAKLKQTLLGQMIWIGFNNTMTVVYINKERGIHSQALNHETSMVLYE